MTTPNLADLKQSQGPDLVPARMVNEFVYCPRLAYLEWVQGEWDDNLDTIHGRFVHRRVDDEPATEVPAADEADPTRPQAARSVMLSSLVLGAIARMDLMEITGRSATPVDYKRGAAPDLPQGAYDPERVQLCLQGLILRDNGYESDSGVLYFAASKTRVEIPFDDELIKLTVESVAGLRALADSGRMPPPLVDSPKCVRCSLAGICLPDEVNRLTLPDLPSETRRLVPARDDRIPLYVQAQGGTIGKRDERLTIVVKGQPPEEVRLLELSHVAVFGNVQVTTQALRALCDQETAIAYLSFGGWFYGLTTGLGHKNIELRIAQHRAVDAGQGLPIARALVAGKILNQRTLLRRNLPERDAKLAGRLALYARQARYTQEPASLLGIEGMAAKLYFEGFPRLFRGVGSWAGAVFAEGGRNRRPPRDEVNAVLSFLYAMLIKDCTLAANLVGFDAFRGFYHMPKYGRPALALDLCEEFRPLIGDSVCITLFNQGEVTRKDFVKRARGVALTSAGRRAVIAAYERRMNQLVTHPVFAYTISYRRVIEVQARLMRATILGEVPAYRPFTTR